ncbi:MAG: hypothetical protein GEV03_03865 [Streptosporangiales bacterium]|nr:hypothetical protein [Streptosporangiales bacterium]
MHEVSWARAGGPGGGPGGALWLRTSRPESHPVWAGITFGAGSLHQPVEHLGVASLLAAWLTTGLSRPVEAAEDAANAAQVWFRLGLTDSSLVVTGTVEGVAATLRRMDGLLADASYAEVDDTLRDRARTHSSPLGPWTSHLVARWLGHRPHLAARRP